MALFEIFILTIIFTLLPSSYSSTLFPPPINLSRPHPTPAKMPIGITLSEYIVCHYLDFSFTCMYLVEIYLSQNGNRQPLQRKLFAKVQNQNFYTLSPEWSRMVEMGPARVFTKISQLDATMHFGWFKNRKHGFNQEDKRTSFQSIKCLRYFLLKI